MCVVVPIKYLITGRGGSITSKIYLCVLCVTYLGRNRAYFGCMKFVAYGGSHDDDARFPPKLSP